MRRSILWIASLLFLLSSATASPGEDGAAVRVLCLGDSITAGARAQPDEAYPAQLGGLLGPDYLVQNLGVGGATLLKSGTPTVWERLERVEDFLPDVVIVALGTNDTVGAERRNWEAIGAFDGDYQELIERLAALPTRPRILACTPTDMVLETEGLAPARRANLVERRPRLQELCRRITTLARRNGHRGVELVDLTSVLAGRPELLTKGDGVHPNAAGYRAIAEAIAPIVARSTQPPLNLVLFLVDDMGWQDTSVPFHTEVTDFNRRYRTPNMERLAARGMKFTQAYASAICSPTRISLMTGQNAARHRVTNWTLRFNASNDRPHPRLEPPLWNVNGLSPVAGYERTVVARPLPDVLREAGYRTIHAGKAHFGAIRTPGEDPTQLGFDVNIAGHAAGGPGSYYGEDHYSATRREKNPSKDTVWDVPGLEAYHGKEVFLTEAITREATREIRRAAQDEVPFYLYLSHYAVHAPIMPDPRYVDHYEGLHPVEAAYASLVEGMDASLGSVMATLDELGITESTVVLFMSDNGGVSHAVRGGERFTHNRPLSSGKGSAHEGGIRVPMIVSWPEVTPPATTCSLPVIIEDFYSTLVELAGGRLDAELDGWSFVPLLRGAPHAGADLGDRYLVWHQPNQWINGAGPGLGPHSSIRSGDWKLIYYHDPGRAERFELFDLANDLGERKNLVAGEPERVGDLSRLLSDALRGYEAQMPTVKEGGEPVPLPDGQGTR